MAYNRLNEEDAANVNKLPEALKVLADDILLASHDTGSFHDSAVDMLEAGELSDYSDEQVKTTLEAMGSHWS